MSYRDRLALFHGRRSRALREIVTLKRRFDACLLIDEAHATGVLGEHGTGAAELLGVKTDVDVVVGTLSKAIGALGGFVAGPRVLVDTIRNTGRAFIYTTALPPAICAAAIKSLEIIEREPHRRKKLLDMSASTCARLSALPAFGNVAAGPDGAIATQIIPLVIGEARKVLEVSRALLEAGFLVPAIRPPTVPRGTSRLRISLCAGHENGDLDRFVSALGATM